MEHSNVVVFRAAVLSNKYYTQLLNANWKQIFINNEDLEGIPNRWMWTKGGGRGKSDNRFMLDSDMALRVNFEDYLEADGEVTCPLKTKSGCPLAMDEGMDTFSLTEEYAKDNLLWLTDFQMAYEKMLTTGYGVESDGCTEPPCKLPELNPVEPCVISG